MSGDAVPISRRALLIWIALALLMSGVALFVNDRPYPTAMTPISGGMVLDDVAVIVPAFVEATRVNVNTATAVDLQRLSGIGEALARRIVAYRDEHGPFASLDALQAVNGVGRSTVERFRDQATVGDIDALLAPQ